MEPSKIDVPNLTAPPPPSKGHELRDRAHPHCFACAPNHPAGLKMVFSDLPDGGVRTTFPCPDSFEGYPGYVHGGIISTLMDCAMANCLFAAGLQAVTAELVVKFRRPVLIGSPVEIQARIVKDMNPLYALEASVSQDGVVKANANAKFFLM